MKFHLTRVDMLYKTKLWKHLICFDMQLTAVIYECDKKMYLAKAIFGMQFLVLFCSSLIFCMIDTGCFFLGVCFDLPIALLGV